jgi:hypothetical protein
VESVSVLRLVNTRGIAMGMLNTMLGSIFGSNIIPKNVARL